MELRKKREGGGRGREVGRGRIPLLSVGEGEREEVVGAESGEGGLRPPARPRLPTAGRVR